MDTYKVSTFKGVLAGSGIGALTLPEVCQAAIDMVEKKFDGKITVVYLGTATYDISRAELAQTTQFKNLGCEVVPLRVAGKVVPKLSTIQETIRRADIILVSGGNTLWALDRWKLLGIDQLLSEAADRGVVFCGGSAGAICWFDGGHSRSADPVVFYSQRENMENATTELINSSSDWEYIRVDGLGFLPGLCVVHFDKAIEGGMVRARDVENLARKLDNKESVIGIDHWAALIINKGQYSTLSIDGKPGSNQNGKFTTDSSIGTPGVWNMHLTSNDCHYNLVHGNAIISKILKPPASPVLSDSRCEAVRKANPQEKFVFEESC